MAEMLVRTVDKEDSGDPLTQIHRLGRGDVVVIVDDGWPWSDGELNAPFWTIVKLPGVKASDLSAYVAPDPGYGDHDALLKNRMLRRRGFKFDLDTAIATGKAQNITLDDALNLKVAKPTVADPNAVG